MQPSYIADVNEQILGVASGITPDGTRIIAISRLSTKNGNGIVVYRSTDGKEWTTKFFIAPAGVAIYGVAFVPSTGAIVGMYSPNANTITVYRSTDFGDTWETKTVTHGIPQLPGTGLNVLVADEARNRIIAYNYSTPSTASVRTLAVQSFDNGDTWSAFITTTENSVRVSMGSIPNHTRGIVGRIWGGTQNLVFYTNSTDNTYATVATTAVAPTPLDYMKAPVAYNGTTNTYSWFNSTSSPSGTGSVLTFNNDFTTFINTSPVISGNSLLGNIVYYPPTGDTILVTFRRNSINAADTKVYKSKNGAGWIEDTISQYQTSAVQFGPNGIFYDTELGILSGYIQGDIYRGSGIGYMGVPSTMPTPTPSATTTMSATPRNNSIPIELDGRIGSVNGIIRTGYVLTNSDGSQVLSVDVGTNPSQNVFGSVPVEGTNEVIIYGNYSTIGGNTVTVAMTRLDMGGTLNTNWSVTTSTGAAISGGTNITTLIKISASEYLFGTSSGRIYKMNADGLVDMTWGTALTGYGSPILVLDRIDPTKVYVGSSTRIVRIDIANGTIDNTFASVTTNASTSAMAITSDGSIIAFGQFTIAGVYNRNYIAKISRAGIVDPTWSVSLSAGSALVAGIPQIAMLNNDSFLLGGNFTTADGQPRTYLIKIKSSGRIDASFSVTLNSSLYSVSETTDGRYLISGNFSTVNSVSRAKVARLLFDGTLDNTYSASISGDAVFSMTEHTAPILTLTPTPTSSVTPTATPVPSAIYDNPLGFRRAVISP